VARIVPSDIGRLALAGAHTPELKTLARLARELGEEFTVFHGVHWSREYKGWSHFGEIDFVVVNQSGDVLLIEQKNGLVEEQGGKLVKEYEDGSRDVVQQLHRSLDKVREKWQWQHGKSDKLEIDYLVYLPDYRVRKVNAIGIDDSRIVDAGATDGLARRIETVLGRGVLNEARYRKVEEFFVQTFDLVPDIRTHVAAQDRQFVRQVGGLADLFENLEMDPYRMRVIGTAGCGKSQLARAYYERQLRAGRRPLLLCYNRPLAERLKNAVSPGGQVNTWYGFCAEFLQSQGEQLDFGAMQNDPAFWTRIQERVTVAKIPEEARFDDLAVDEGQDFEQEWYEIVRLFLRDGAGILWLEDPNQNLQGKAPVFLKEFARYTARANYRSPESIARFIRNTLPFEFELGNSLPGLGVGLTTYDDPKEQVQAVTRIVAGLRKQGFGLDDIVLMTYRGVGSSTFSELDQVAGYKLRRFTGEYAPDGSQIMTDGQLTFESIYRFKGQEAPAVIFVDIDPNPSHPDRAMRLLYCGMTRATVRLELLTTSNTLLSPRLGVVNR